MKLCLPSDFKTYTLEKYNDINSTSSSGTIYETYGSINFSDIGTGRNENLLSKITLNDLKEYVKVSNNFGIKFNYIFNTACLGNSETDPKFKSNFLSFVNELVECGINDITLAIPYLIELTNKNFPEINITGSIISQINSLSKAKAYKDLGLNRVILSEDINRNFDLIKTISKIFPNNIEVIINSNCLFNCPYREFHRNSTSHCKEPNKWYFKCRKQIIENPENLLKSQGIIRPEDICFYEEAGVNYFKLAGREFPSLHPDYDFSRTAETYLQRSFDGNLVSLLLHFVQTGFTSAYIDNKSLNGFMDHWLSKKAPCLKNNDCIDCGYCKQYLEKAIKCNFNPDYYQNILSEFSSSIGMQAPSSIEKILYNYA